MTTLDHMTMRRTTIVVAALAFGLGYVASSFFDRGAESEPEISRRLSAAANGKRAAAGTEKWEAMRKAIDGDMRASHDMFTQRMLVEDDPERAFYWASLCESQGYDTLNGSLVKSTHSVMRGGVLNAGRPIVGSGDTSDPFDDDVEYVEPGRD